MADVFIDCEWIQGEYLTILGAYSFGQGRFQLYDETLTRNRFSRFLNSCYNRSGSRYTFLFCHGPDIGRVMEYFDLRLKQDYYCINTVTAFNTFTRSFGTEASVTSNSILDCRGNMRCHPPRSATSGTLIVGGLVEQFWNTTGRTA